MTNTRRGAWFRPVVSGNGLRNLERSRHLGSYEKHREILTKLRGEGRTLAQIAFELSMTHHRVSFLCAVLRIGKNGVPLGDSSMPSLTHLQDHVDRDLLMAIRAYCSWDRGW